MWALLLALIAIALLFWGRREGVDETLGVDEIKFQNEPNFAPLPPPAEMIPPRPELSLPSAPMPVATTAPQPVGGNVRSIPISTADGPIVINIYGSKDILSGKHNGSLPAPVGGPTPVPQQSA